MRPASPVSLHAGLLALVAACANPAGAPCRVAFDCDVDERCDAARCVSRCQSDDECEPGLACLAGKCQTAPTPACVGGQCREECLPGAGLIYLVTATDELWSFDPLRAGSAAYARIGVLSCAPDSSPQSMAVDRTGLARVAYGTGDVYEVSTTTANCRPTRYRHPGSTHLNLLGMAFAAAESGESRETLFIHSSRSGLASVDPVTYETHLTQALRERTLELAGGPEGRLLLFDSKAARLTELDRATFSEQPIAKFPELGPIGAFAIAPWNERVYLFTAGSTGARTTTTELDTRTGVSRVRDELLGFRVVGAGRSTCPVPIPL